MYLVDLTGKSFGRLVVIGPHKLVNGYLRWKCACECGAEKWIDTYNLTSGHTKSCGCFQREMASKKNKTHGGTGSRLHNVWRTILQRCNNPNVKTYQYYGGKGVTLCKEWEDFASFRNWSVHNGYKKGLTIDRIDSAGDYEPSNCRWVSLRRNIAQSRRKLADEDAKFIRKLYGINFFTQKELAELFSIGRGTINNIVNNKSYTKPLGAM